MAGLGEHVVCGIDAVERSHGQMRKDLRSDGRAANVSESCARVFCRQMAVEHARLGGLPMPAVCVREIHSDHDNVQTLGRRDGQAVVRFLNTKVASYKQVYAHTTHNPMRCVMSASKRWRSRIISVRRSVLRGRYSIMQLVSVGVANLWKPA